MTYRQQQCSMGAVNGCSIGVFKYKQHWCGIPSAYLRYTCSIAALKQGRHLCGIGAVCNAAVVVRYCCTYVHAALVQYWCSLGEESLP
jgi:hypothetical protein